MKIWRVGGDADEKRCPVEELKAGIERMNRDAQREQKEGERRLEMQRANECCRARTWVAERPSQQRGGHLTFGPPATWGLGLLGWERNSDGGA